MSRVLSVRVDNLVPCRFSPNGPKSSCMTTITTLDPVIPYTDDDGRRTTATSPPVEMSPPTPLNNGRRRGRGAVHHVDLGSMEKARLRKRNSRCTTLCRKMVENMYFVIFTTFLTVYALVGDDFRLLLTEKPVDKVFDVVTITCLFVFVLEIVLSSIGKQDYIWGFFFCLDIISTATLLLDISFVTEWIDGSSEDNEGMHLRSGRTAKLGAKAGRVIRVIRLVRILKLYKAIYEAKARRQRDSHLHKPDEDDWGDDEDEEKLRQNAKVVQESRVGKKLSELTIRRVIILVLTMLLVVPILRVEPVDETPSSAEYGADNVWEAFNDWVIGSSFPTTSDSHVRYQQALLRYVYYHNWYHRRAFLSSLLWLGIASSQGNVQQFNNITRLTPQVVTDMQERIARENIYGELPDEALHILSSGWKSECGTKTKSRSGVSVIEDEVPGVLTYPISCPQQLRNSEYKAYFSQMNSEIDGIKFNFWFYYDIRPFKKEEAIFGLSVTAFICIVLVVASLMFSNDANKLVLNPLEKMTTRVREIRDDPLVAVKMADDEFKEEEKKRARQSSRGNMPTKSFRCVQSFKSCLMLGASASSETLETVILEKTIIKLGSLLALGFGEAGANIIRQNMRASDSAGVNVMIPGTKVDCIVGKARIRDFSTATEVLQAKVMTFVNQIAEIVHGIVDEMHGAANKNAGDTFLLIWRISDMDDSHTTRVTDLSIIAFAKIYGAIHRSLTLAYYRGHPGFQQRLGANCRVNVSFGLHAGWTIEGAVGTEFKIDASYLSPNVSIASSVECATFIYGVAILISESVENMASPGVAQKCRLLDRVIIRGSQNPMKLFSLDLDYTHVALDLPRESSVTWNSRQRFKVRQFLQAEKSRNLSPDLSMERVLETAEDLAVMRRQYKTEFMQLFNMGYQNYSQGEWVVARRLLSDTRNMLHVEDGPSVALLRFMEHPYRFRAPDSWHGVRELHLDNLSS
eukprot:TRINITY_DN7975_c0_g3_i1.p1 TRINITY_DN7975_c0_g3~~TRINITY_DN7975_c0_g3_i1.p1  ORF type:complete len:971 (+),score=159.98 TRINITY_DN7975_c0_g3_i1:176-3088(+)